MKAWGDRVEGHSFKVEEETWFRLDQKEEIVPHEDGEALHQVVVEVPSPEVFKARLYVDLGNLF